MLLYQLMFSRLPILHVDICTRIIYAKKSVQLVTDFSVDLERSHHLGRQIVEDVLTMAQQRQALYIEKRE